MARIAFKPTNWRIPVSSSMHDQLLHFKDRLTADRSNQMHAKEKKNLRDPYKEVHLDVHRNFI